MFTGIVTRQGRVAAVERRDAGVERLVLEVAPSLPGVGVGDSVAVQGACLTATAVDGGEAGDAPARYAFDVVPETLRKTTLGALAPGDRVNVEPPLRVGDALGGHWVQGHVDGVGEVAGVSRVESGDDVRLEVLLPEPLAGDAIPKGSVTIDGVSLTVGEVGVREGRAWFSVYLIPHTLEVTTLAGLERGAPVNLEMDVLGRWVAHHLARLGAGDRPVTD